MKKNSIEDIIPTKLFMDCMPGLSYVYNKDGHLLAWSTSKTWDVLGYSDEELQDKFILEFTDDEGREKITEAFQTVLEKGSAQVEHNALTKDGKKIPVLASAAKVIMNGEEYVVGLTLDISDLADARERIREQLREIQSLNEQLIAKNDYLQKNIEIIGNFQEIIGDSESIEYAIFKAEQVAPTDAPVLIEGETGTGKEMIARLIHKNSTRKDQMFVRVNCASIPENLIESEMFGHTAGAFTGATGNRKGRFEIAEGGTLFLDEIGELPIHVQAKLLNVLQDGTYEKVGSSVTNKSDVRIIAATNRVLNDEVITGNFRKDLFYRINVFPITVGPLRHRREDILPLTNFFLKKYSQKFNIPIEVVTQETWTKLKNYDWPGNIRELENIVERGVISSKNKILNIENLLNPSDLVPLDNVSLDDYEKNYILEILNKTNWKISGTGGAADILNINHQTLRSKIKKLGIKRQSL